jgi:tetratricopeptide (TPR) repeat protein
MALTRSIIARLIRDTIRPASHWKLLLILIALLLGSGVESSHATSGMAVDRLAVERMAAERALMQGQIDEAVTRAHRIAGANPNDGAAYLLLCRSFYAEEHVDKAIDACVKSAQMLPRGSEAEDWLGRAYGMKAERAGPISGLTLALKVKAAFETAAALDPRNGAAANDLSEFYIDAPSIIGGGLDRAGALADHVEPLLPQQAHRMRALAAEKRKDYGTAEREFKAAVEVANQPDAWADLGMFYWQRGEPDKAVDALKQCLALDRTKDASIVDAASLLNQMHREPELAEQALQEYLEGNAKSDAAPAIKVYVMLGKQQAGEGDKAEAKIEFDKALAMASSYAPARQALQELK